ncbi:helix-turn-helix domain-containing protein [Sorangium sp. So ce124]|uniref:helix-turn-helix domain-containing protein n=1 Tax=Sorangium sp. So ce124 TaxID=3133280 RepID=UPI003F620D43
MCELERLTGYTSRWLNRKFAEQLGASPKGLGSILRLQHCYQALLTGSSDAFLQKAFYRHCYDESHFIREFKRFTGMPPSKLLRTKNDFGRLFYDE